MNGIGPGRAEKIVRGGADQKAIREVMLFLHQYGISKARAVRICKILGDQAIQIIIENPYILAREIKGIGFVSADAIAQKISISKEASLRMQAGIHRVFLEATNGFRAIGINRINDSIDQTRFSLNQLPKLAKKYAVSLENIQLIESHLFI